MGGKRPWSSRHLTMVTWAMCMQGVYTGATARFISSAYTLVAQNFRNDGGTGVDEVKPHLDQLGLIRTVLRCDPLLQDSASNAQDDAVWSLLPQRSGILEAGIT